MTPPETLHTGPVALSQEQSDLVWDVLEGNAAVVSLLRAQGARPIPKGALERSWEAVQKIIPATGECDSVTARTVQHFLSSIDAMERLPQEVPHGSTHDSQRPDAGLDSGWCHRLPLGNPPVRETRERRERMVSWAEEPTPREWAFHAVCSQMRADQRRLERAQERREFWRVVRCDLAAFAGILVTMAVCYAVAWGLWALVGR